MTKETMAFPQAMSAGSMAVAEGGLTMRDYIATQALSGMLANGYDLFVAGEYRTVGFANDAYEFADALMAAREAKL